MNCSLHEVSCKSIFKENNSPRKTETFNWSSAQRGSLFIPLFLLGIFHSWCFELFRVFDERKFETIFLFFFSSRLKRHRLRRKNFRTSFSIKLFKKVHSFQAFVFKVERGAKMKCFYCRLFFADTKMRTTGKN